jgi:hypothetical protein
MFCPELGRFNDDIKMPIPFNDNADLKDLLQRPYNMSTRDKRAMNNILQSLTEIGAIEPVPLDEICAVASSAFVMWRNDKPRMVVDLGRVNAKLVIDGYPLSKQEDIQDILASIGGCRARLRMTL